MELTYVLINFLILLPTRILKRLFKRLLTLMSSAPLQLLSWLPPSVLRKTASSQVKHTATGCPISQDCGLPRRCLCLVNLPLEILTEIVRELSWPDILRLRQTCTHFANITKTLPVWRAVAHAELSGNSSCTPQLSLERPLNAHSADELERIILRWKSAEVGWSKDDPSPARERRLKMSDVESIHLIKGGRWLLVSTRTGSVVFYDLDEEEPARKVLIPTVSEPAGTIMSVDIDQSSPTLTFHLALGTAKYRSDTSKEYVVEVWRVCLVDTAESRLSTLSAKLSASFRPEPQSQVTKLSILGDFVAFCLDLRPASSFYTIVVKWTDLGEVPSSYPRWLKHTYIFHFDGVQLLPQHQVLLRQGHHVRLFDFFSFWHSPPLPSNLLVADVEPLWEVEIGPMLGRFLPEPVIYGDCARLVIATKIALFGLTIPHPSTRIASDPPGRLVKLCDIPRGISLAPSNTAWT
ncbi:hypothetical protein BDN72DRAFT_966281 [Pluteus cervinus]|uniref:Uncharacterized protein n=1 Tax=Pluteus cervinus TaxID=181527 RepID=A0ACD2ZZC2_9AGAR|nr:hypothetical protein BDN72DRAFT_966281 [Pluteus cervinus]